MKLCMLDDMDLIIAGDFNQYNSRFKQKAMNYGLNTTKFAKTRVAVNAKETDIIASTFHLEDNETRKEAFISDHLILKTSVKIKIEKRIFYRTITNRMINSNINRTTILSLFKNLQKWSNFRNHLISLIHLNEYTGNFSRKKRDL